MIAVFLLLLAGCSSDEKRPTEDSLMAAEAITLIDGLKKAYERKDFSAMERFFASGSFDTVKNRLREFESVKLDIKPQMIEVEPEGTLKARVLWSGTWTTPDGQVQKGGALEMRLAGKPLRIKEIIQGNPFRHPEGQRRVY